MTQKTDALQMMWVSTRKHFLNVAIVVLLILSCVLLTLLYALTRRVIALHSGTYNTDNSTEGKIPAWPTGFFPHNTYGFHPVNERGVYSFWNVCIEALRYPVTRETDFLGAKIYYNETARIIAYNSFYRTGEQRLHVAGSHNSAWNNWDVFFRRGQIPENHTFFKTTAFFITQTCPANLHHFWIDEFVPLFSTVRQANRLIPQSNNQIIYRRPTDLAGTDIKSCYNKTTYERILQTLFIRPLHDVFYHMPLNTCYSSAVFGTHPALSDPRVVVDHVLNNTIGNASLLIGASSSYFVTFVQRRYRQILNIRELLQATLLAGFRRVRIVDFEKHSVEEQMKISATSCVMIGVQGAGLQWAVFMPRGCTLIEIAWPSQHWGFHFRSYVEPYGIHYYALRAVNAKINWRSYERNVRHGTSVPMAERLQLLSTPPKNPSTDNVWKWADAFVDKIDLIEIISNIEPNPRPPVPPSAHSLQ